MRAIRFHTIGGPEVLVYEEVANPKPKAGSVLVRVEATGVNFADVMRRRGDDYPEHMCVPFAAIIRVPPGVSAVRAWGFRSRGLRVSARHPERIGSI